MAMRTKKIILGVDTSQEWLDGCRYGDSKVVHFANERKAIDHWLMSYAGQPVAIAIEATNIFHELIVARALRFGMTVYLISGYQLRHYANSLNVRMRTDAVDAQLLARFLDREIDDLRPYQPPSPDQQALQRLLKRRALLVKQQQQLQQSFASMRQLRASAQAVISRLQQLIGLIDKRMRQLAHRLGWQQNLRLLRSLPGVGPLNALALCVAYHSGDFPHRDPFIAFLGLDVRTKDSGKHKGRRKLTKKGQPEYRRLLHNAAMAAVKQGRHFQQDYSALQARGMSKIAALVVIARKIARLAFAVLRSQVPFDPQQHRNSCRAT